MLIRAAVPCASWFSRVRAFALLIANAQEFRWAALFLRDRKHLGHPQDHGTLLR